MDWVVYLDIKAFWMHRHTAPFADCHDQNRPSWGVGLDKQAFSASGADVDGLELAVFDPLQQGLAGDTVGEGSFEHGEPPSGRRRRIGRGFRR
jgi:hypothetical protein